MKSLLLEGKGQHQIQPKALYSIARSGRKGWLIQENEYYGDKSGTLAAMFYYSNGIRLCTDKRPNEGNMP
jgi:hypothetical protein